MVASAPAGGMEIRRETAGANALGGPARHHGGARLCARHGAGGRSPDDAAGHGRPQAAMAQPAMTAQPARSSRWRSPRPSGRPRRRSPSWPRRRCNGCRRRRSRTWPRRWRRNRLTAPPAAPAPRKMPNLFSRVTGKRAGRGSRPARDPGAGHPAAAGQPGAASGRPAAAPPAQRGQRRLPRSLPPPQPTYTAQPAAACSCGPPPVQPRLSGLDPKDRLATSRAEEDLLDIPAFLRRQAN